MERVVLITGASSGIGRSTALEFAKLKDKLVLHYNRSEEEIKNLKKEIENDYGISPIVVKADLSRKEEVEKLLDKLQEKNIEIDILINNAGIALDSLFEDKTWENFEETLRVNLIAPFFIARYCGEKMFERKKGVIINVSSTNGINSYYPMSVDYDASKAGIISLTHNLALQYKPYVRVNSVAPGWINTRMNKELDQEFIEEENKKIFIERFAQPEEIAKVIVFLASNDASYINNEIIKIDGGSY